MKRSESIFDSKAEREIFESLEGRFGDAGRLVPQLPLSKLVKLEAGDQLTESEAGFLYKTNVDYTFADHAGRPLFSIEFDGIGGGYSRAGIYVPTRATGDPKREWKLDFKLRVAREIGYPLMILSFDEAEPLAEGESLTVLDGIVGYFLSRLKGQLLIDQRLAEAQEELDLIDDEDLRFETAQDLVWGAEIEAEFEFDPLTRALADLQQGLSSYGHGTRWLYDPPVPEFRFEPGYFPTQEGIERRARLIKQANRVGVRAEVWSHDPRLKVRETVWIRNLAGEFGMMEMIAEKIALYLGFRRLRAELGKLATRSVGVA